MLLRQCNNCGTKNPWGIVNCSGCRASLAEVASSEDVLDEEGRFAGMRWRITEEAIHATNPDCQVTLDTGNRLVAVRRGRRRSGFPWKMMEWGPLRTTPFENVEWVKVFQDFEPSSRNGDLPDPACWTFRIRMKYRESHKSETLDLGRIDVTENGVYLGKATAQAIVGAIYKMLGSSEGGDAIGTYFRDAQRQNKQRDSL